MEVHPPEHGIHSWRDFLVHMGTITLGLLIALGLEHAAEVMHERHLLHTAERNLHNEVRANRATLAQDQAALTQTERQLLQHLRALQAAEAHTASVPDSFIHWEWNGPQSAAWDTARNSGAAALMDYELASGFALLYTQQKIVNDQAALYVRDLYEGNALVSDTAPITSMAPEAIRATIEANQRTLTDLRLLRDYNIGLSHLYDDLGAGRNSTE